MELTASFEFQEELVMTLSRCFRSSSMLLVFVLLSNSFAFAVKKAPVPAVMKAKIQARGVGQGVRVSLADQSEAKGLIVAIDDHSFTLKPRKKSADVRQIDYAQLTGVHNEHLTRGQKVAIVAGITAAGIGIFAILIIEAFNHWGGCFGPCSTTKF